jgi:CTP synthase
LYGEQNIIERHRHRYECNNKYLDQYASWGIRASGKSPDGGLVEMVEGIDHPFLLGSQAHPEFKSRPTVPHPMFVGLIDACTK